MDDLRQATRLDAIGGRFDPWLLGVSIALACMGVVMVGSAAIAGGGVDAGPWYFLSRHAMFLAGGLVLATIVMRTELKWVEQHSRLLLLACAILLPVGLEYNKTVAGERYRAVGKAMGVKGIDEMNDAQAADATIAAVKKLSADVGIPTNLNGILKEEDIQFLAESAYADACRPGNPRDTSVEEIVELYKSQL